MTTALQQAAQQALEILKDENQFCILDARSVLRKALADEQAQETRTALEQYDLDQSADYQKGWNDGRIKGYEVGHRYATEANQAQAVEPANWKAHIQTARNVYSDYLDVQEALNYLEQVFLAATPAMSLSEILAAKGITLQKTFVEKPRDHVDVVRNMVGERAELIAGQKEMAGIMASYGHAGCAELLIESADMLEADAQEIALYAGTLESRDRNIASLVAENVRLAQQVAVPAKSEPLSPSELHLVYCNDLSAGDWHRAKENYVAGFTAAERHHGIKAKLVTKPDSQPQNCGTGHCSCIECPYPKPDWSAA